MGKVFLTGVTGSLGIELLREILEATDYEIVVLIRASSYQAGLRRLLTSADRVALRRADLLDRTTVVIGDLEEKYFGLEKSSYQQLVGSVTHIIHCAASISLSQNDDQAKRNILNPLHLMLELIKACTQLQRVDYVSTVGVGGRDFHSLPESLDIDPRSFHNSYERFKYEAEVEFRRGLPENLAFTVHRPSMIIGRSDSGRINSFQIFYSICELLSGELTGGVIPDMTNKAFDMIPVDWVAKGVVACLNQPDTPEVLHHCVGSDQSISLGEIEDYITKNRKPVTHVPIASFKAVYPMMTPFLSESQRKKQRFLPYFLEYLSTEQKFENKKSRAFLRDQAELEFDSPLRGIRRSLKFYQRHGGGEMR